MAPEQFDGKAVFASDLYSFGVMMYQMLTGTLPYDTPTPGDLGRLRSGELLSPPRLREPSIPKALNDIVMKAMAPDLRERYQRASDLLNDLEASRPSAATGALNPQSMGQVVAGLSADRGQEIRSIQSRLLPRVPAEAKFCWHCQKPLHARTNRCPFCNEIQ